MRNDPLDTFGKRLRHARRARGLTQDALADAAGEGQGTISKMELGKIAKSGNVAMLAKALGVSVDWLALNEGPSGLEDAPDSGDLTEEAAAIEGSWGNPPAPPRTQVTTWSLASQTQGPYRADPEVSVRRAVIALVRPMEGLNERSRRNVLKIISDLVDKPEDAEEIAAEAEAFISATKQHRPARIYRIADYIGNGVFNRSRISKQLGGSETP